MYEVWVYLTLMIPGYFSPMPSIAVCCIIFFCGNTDSSIDGLSLSFNCLYAFL